MLCITFAFLLHGTHIKWGVRLQNALGAFKLVILVGIAGSGLAVLLGLPGFKLSNVRVLFFPFVSCESVCMSMSRVSNIL